MKILFLIYHGFSEVSGISKKIRYQVKGLCQNGHEVHLCYYDRGTNGHWQRMVEAGGRTTEIEDYGTGKLAACGSALAMAPSTTTAQAKASRWSTPAAL